MNLHFDLLASSYDRLIAPPDPARLRTLLRLPIAGWLLDVGGGTGRVAALLQAQVDHLVICDLSAPMLQQASAKGVACPVQAHVGRLPFPNDFFDRVLVVDALHHFSHQPAAIAELVCVLSLGGRLVIEEPDIDRLPVKLVALGEKLALMGSHFSAPEEIAAMAAGHGGRVAVDRDGQFSAWITFDKA